MAFIYKAHPWGRGSAEQPVLGGIPEGKRWCACSSSPAEAGVVALVAVPPTALGAPSAPYPGAGRSPSLRHHGDVVGHLVRLFGEVGRLSAPPPPRCCLFRAQAQFEELGGKPPKAVSVGKERDWISTCIPEPDSAPFLIQGHQMRTAKSKTHPLVFTPFTYLSYIQRPIPHTLSPNSPLTLPRAPSLNADPACIIIEINISAI